MDTTRSAEGLATVQDDGTATVQEINIPTPPLLKTCTDVMFMISDLLPMADLCNFRQSCQYVKVQVSHRFTTRAYKHVRMCDRHSSVRSIGNIMQGNKELAKYPRALTVVHATINPACSCCTKESAGWTLSDVLSKLPNLEKLELHSITSGTIACHFVRQHVLGGVLCWRHASPQHQLVYIRPNLPQLTTLSIRSAKLTSRDLRAFVIFAGARLVNLSMNQIDSTNGNWVHVMQEILHTSTGLEKLQLRTLREFTGSERFGFRSITFHDCKDISDKFSKAFRGLKGIEVAVLGFSEANMKGAQGIRWGLERIVEHLAGRAEGL
ncbi:hypothetical protein LTR17_016689 [Elasticomyces elasticus]|nr:hypothetical protein LTR17_016689 [Elasticomyces elasticus]